MQRRLKMEKNTTNHNAESKCPMWYLPATDISTTRLSHPRLMERGGRGGGKIENARETGSPLGHCVS